jgi:hypothetical protein
MEAQELQSGSAVFSIAGYFQLSWLIASDML